MSDTKLRPFPIVATLVVLLAVATMIALGFWQLRRLAEKEALLARYMDAERTSVHAPLPGKASERAQVWFHHTAVDCEGSGTTEPRAGRNERGEAGWAQWGRCIADPDLVPTSVNLGWSRQPAAVKYTLESVVGTIAPDDAEGARIVADAPLGGLNPSARPDPRDIPNNHLSYAVQWFLFALTAIVIYVLALRTRWRSGR